MREDRPICGCRCWVRLLLPSLRTLSGPTFLGFETAGSAGWWSSRTRRTRQDADSSSIYTRVLSGPRSVAARRKRRDEAQRFMRRKSGVEAGGQGRGLPYPRGKYHREDDVKTSVAPRRPRAPSSHVQNRSYHAPWPSYDTCSSGPQAVFRLVVRYWGDTSDVCPKPALRESDRAKFALRQGTLIVFTARQELKERALTGW